MRKIETHNLKMKCFSKMQRRSLIINILKGKEVDKQYSTVVLRIIWDKIDMLRTSVQMSSTMVSCMMVWRKLNSFPCMFIQDVKSVRLLGGPIIRFTCRAGRRLEG